MYEIALKTDAWNNQRIRTTKRTPARSLFVRVSQIKKNQTHTWKHLSCSVDEKWHKYASWYTMPPLLLTLDVHKFKYTFKPISTRTQAHNQTIFERANTPNVWTIFFYIMNDVFWSCIFRESFTWKIIVNIKAGF